MGAGFCGSVGWCAAGAVLWGLVGCSPVFDWRDVRPLDSRVQVQFPCKPTSQRRAVALAGPAVTMTLYACGAGDHTWGLSYADVADAQRVAPALAALAAAAAANVGAQVGPLQTLPVPGATPQAPAGQMRLLGKRPDGATVQLQVAMFAHGTQVYQATVLGARISDEAAETFFSSLRVGR